jgi:hypothetical protein
MKSITERNTRHITNKNFTLTLGQNTDHNQIIRNKFAGKKKDQSKKATNSMPERIQNRTDHKNYKDKTEKGKTSKKKRIKLTQ